MTKSQFNKKLNRMTREVVKSIGDECQRLFNSGGVGEEAYQDNYLLPKIILSVALKNVSYQYAPLSPPDKATAKNLEHF